MWILSSDGDLLGGKKLWLRPGSTHLLGRTSGRPENGERCQYIDHKSVSRKHVVIEVGEVKPGDSGRLHARTEIKITDASKSGTILDGDKFAKESRTLGSKGEYIVKLGSYEPLFRLEWRPVVLSFTNLTKSTKSTGDALASFKTKLEGIDVKLMTDYLSQVTTHVVAKKRNNPHVLQGLVQGRWIVTEAYVDLLTIAATRSGREANGDQKASPLEEDFDSNWPSEEICPVPAGAEPVPREDSYLKPVPERGEVFHDFVFVFLAQSQHDTLMAVITSGGGKAVCWDVEPGQSKVVDIVERVRELAGKKKGNLFRLSQYAGPGGVVVVRLSEEQPEAVEFMQDLDLALDQRSIRQNELLDVILINDASELRKPLLETQGSVAEANGTVAAPASPPTNTGQPPQPEEQEPQSVPTQQQQQDVEMEDEPPLSSDNPAPQPEDDRPAEPPVTAARKRNRRIITQSRFKGFDDFDPSQIIRAASQSPEPTFQRPDQSQAPSVQSIDADEPSQLSRTQQPSNTRKRSAPTADEENDNDNDEDDLYETLLTGQAALKRRRTEAAARGDKSSFAQPLPTGEERLATKRAEAKLKKQAKVIDVKADLKARRDREEELRLQNEEALRQEFEGVDLSELRNLAQVVEMEVPVREPPARRGAEGGAGERWDPVWNGRRNFKKFRPQGLSREGPRLQRVIVTLEEVPRRGLGGDSGDGYYLTSTTTQSSRKSQSQTQNQQVRAGALARSEGEGDEAATFRRRVQLSRVEDAQTAADERLDRDAIAGRARDVSLLPPPLSASSATNSTPSQTLATGSQRQAAVVGKRSAGVAGLGAGAGLAPPAKKTRQTTIASTAALGKRVGDEDEDDGIGFRRRERRR